MVKNRPLRLFGVSMAVALSGAALAGMTALAQDESPAASAGTGSEQVVQEVLEGDLCTPAAYGGTGVEVIDLASATIGFAQSEKEANPFRIAETQSIKDEAAARGINLITTNANSDLNKEISDIKSMVDQGADALIISPLNSEGLDEALEYARDAGVPIMTIDRFLTSDVVLRHVHGLGRLRLRGAGTPGCAGDDPRVRRRGQPGDPAGRRRRERDG